MRRLLKARENQLFGVLIAAIVGLLAFAWIVDDTGTVTPVAIDEVADTRDDEPVEDTPVRPLTVFLGDSYTGGSAEGGNDYNGYWAFVSAELGLDGQPVAEGGTGWTTAPSGKTKFGERITDVIRSKPAMVVLFGSRNDSDAVAVRTAAARALKRLRSELPDADLVVVAPPWVNGNPPAYMVRIRDALRSAAASVQRVSFVDALAERWFAGRASRFIGDDGVHPTDQGHRYMADKLTRHLRSMNLETVKRGLEAVGAASGRRAQGTASR